MSELGSKADLTVRTSDFRFSPGSRHLQPRQKPTAAHVRAEFKSGHFTNFGGSQRYPKCNAAVQAALGTAAAFRAGIVIAATPTTTQPSPI